MNAMEKMFKSILESMIPPEVLAQITPENMARIAASINEAISNNREMLLDISGKQDRIIELLEAKDDNGNNRRKPRQLPAPSGDGTS